jgi:hypothetical protein
MAAGRQSGTRQGNQALSNADLGARVLVVRPDWVLDRFHDLTERARLPRVQLHDL